jgi:hypothetical protein
MHKLTPEYVVGLVDGEGSFTIYVRDPKSVKIAQRRVTVEPKFYVKLIEKDKQILERLKVFFGCGSIYFQKDARTNHQHCYRYEVYNRRDLFFKIIPFFRKNTLQFPSKKKDFKLFCKMMEIIGREEHLKVKGLNRLLVIKQKMH